MNNLKIRGGLTSVLTMTIENDDITLLESTLMNMMNQAPSLMKGMPVLVKLMMDDHVDKSSFLSEICRLIRLSGANPFMVESHDVFKDSVNALGLSFISLKKDKKTKEIKETELEKEAVHYNNALIVRETVRSGQQIYAKNRDLIILSNVNRGAEIVSDGNILVFGFLKGKAIAGISGNEKSMILSKHMDAELVSINGIYAINEDFCEKVTHQNHSLVTIKNDELFFSSI